MAGVRDMTIALPQPCEQEAKTGSVELERRVRKTLRVRIEAPHAELLHPFNRSNRSRWIPTTNVYAVTVSMAADGRSGVVESLDRTDELVAVLHIGRVEVERAGVAQVSFRDESAEYDQLMPVPLRAPQCRQRPRHSDMITRAQLPELVPSRDGEKRVLGGGRDLPAETSAQLVEHLVSAGDRPHHAASLQTEIRVTGERGDDRHAARRDVLDRDGAAGIGVDHARLAPDALREAVERERGDALHDLVLYGADDAARGHPVA